MVGEKNIKAILFDLDGTLLNTKADITYAINSAVIKANFEEISEELCISYVGRGLYKALLDILTDKGYRGSEEDIKELYEGLLYTYRTNPYQRSTVYEGISELLEKLVVRNVGLGILSNKEDVITQVIVEHVFKDFPFSFIRGSDTSYPPKPNPYSALEFASLCGCKAENVLVVGDTLVDYKTAVAANMQRAIVTWGFRTKEELIEAGCSPLYDTVEQLEQEVLRWV
ncbi:MAG: HAD family hydrolase [Sphaerochaetaceae bacterium]